MTSAANELLFGSCFQWKDPSGSERENKKERKISTYSPNPIPKLLSVALENLILEQPGET